MSTYTAHNTKLKISHFKCLTYVLPRCAYEHIFVSLSLVGKGKGEIYSVYSSTEDRTEEVSGNIKTIIYIYKKNDKRI